jgi:hypothetical protein
MIPYVCCADILEVRNPGVNGSAIHPFAVTYAVLGRRAKTVLPTGYDLKASFDPMVSPAGNAGHSLTFEAQRRIAGARR